MRVPPWLLPTAAMLLFVVIGPYVIDWWETRPPKEVRDDDREREEEAP